MSSTAKWTPQQQAAIDAQGGSVLVSAAAGSGKTAILTQRIIRRMFDPQNPVPADRFLVVTFTTAAAQEMRRRIADKLRDMAKENPQDEAIKRQQLLFANAKISTIHAFCLDMLRGSFEAVDLAPDFRIADEQEMRVLRQQAITQTLAQLYEGETSEQFCALVELISTTRDDRKVENTVLDFYDFIRSHPFYLQWLDQKLELYDETMPLENSPWGKIILDDLSHALEACITLTTQSLDEMAGDDAIYKAYSPAYLLDLSQLKALEETAKNSSWDAIYAQILNFEFSRLGGLRGYENTQKQDSVKANRDLVKKTIEKLRDSRFCATQAQHKEDIQALRPHAQTLFAAVKLFDSIIGQHKARRRLVDFGDLEHLTIRLLAEHKDGKIQTTPAAHSIAQQFTEILIDEYQDTNAAQDLIFTAISKAQENLFWVGDVKQSIYSFRQAMPQLFLQRAKTSTLYNGKDFPAKIILGKNFRTREELTGGINFIFRSIMSSALGDIDYGTEDALIPGAIYPPKAGVCTQVHILPAEERAADQAVLEARYIAGQISSLLQSGQTIGQGEHCRPIAPGDICILMRSHKSKMQAYTKALADYGVPAWSENNSGFLNTEEIRAVLATLRTVDNPLLSMPMLEAMLSPLFGFLAEDIAQIKAANKKDSLYFAAQHHAQQGNSRCQDFLATLQHLRVQAALLPAHRLIQELYRHTGFLQLVQAMPGGSLRQVNLQLLVTYAQDYEQRGYNGLEGFLRFIDRLEEQGDDLAPACNPSHSAVSILSIHKSKGLEFPVVFLADTGKKFNKTDLRQHFALHSQLGFACVRRHTQTLTQHTTVPLEAVKVAKDRALLSEEMRILYVALTRAREYLYITASVKNPATAVAKLYAPINKAGKLSPFFAAQASSFMDWILMALLHHPDGQALRQLADRQTPYQQTAQGSFAVVITGPATTAEAITSQPQELAAGDSTSTVVDSLCDTALLANWQQQCAFVYPYQGATVTPAKLSVSDILQKNTTDLLKRPAFLSKEGLTAAEKGTAAHGFLQHANLSAAAICFEDELARLVTSGYLTPAQAGVVQPQAIGAFLQSPIGLRMLRSPTVHRELRFLSEITPAQLRPYYAQLPPGQDSIVLQGMADCVFIEGDKAVIIDYKTDRVEDVTQLATLYTTQLQLYAMVLSGHLGVPVTEAWIYSLHQNSAIQVL